MSKVAVKRMSILDFHNENKDILDIGFSFNLNIWNMNLLEKPDFKELAGFGINIKKKNDKNLYPTLKEAFLACIQEHIKKMDQYINVDIPKSEALFKYSWVGQLSSKNKESRVRLNKIIENVNNYHEFLNDEDKINTYFDEHYSQYESVVNEQISIIDLDVKVGDKVYMFSDDLRFHEVDANFGSLFNVSEFSIESIVYEYDFYKSLDESQFRMKNEIDINANIKTKKVGKSEYHPPQLSFSRDKNTDEDILVLRQGVSNYRMFLRENELKEYIEKFKKSVFSSLENL